MKRLTLIFIMFVSFAFAVNAKQRNDSQMITEANKVLKSLPANNKGLIKSTDMPEILRRESQFCVIGYEHGGFAFIANDDRFSAVLGYSDCKYDENNLPPAMLWWMEAINASLDKALESGEQPEMVPPTDFGYPDAVESLVKTKWNQGTPYNNKCPTYTSSTTTQHYVTGCVATAMSQVMKYHNYPAKGKATQVYDVFYPNGSSESGVTVKAYLGVTYDWDNMIENYEQVKYTDAQANAVATLMFNNGVAVKMQYSKNGSAAFSKDAAKALKTYFSYSIKFMERRIYSTKEWMDNVYNELSNGFPIIYAGQSNSGGHSFVLDGYDANGLVHVNWGWGGSGDGYFDVADLNGYDTYQDMIRTHPLDKEENEIPYTSTWGMEKPFNASIVSGKEVEIGTDDLYNFDADPFTGSIALGVISLSSNSATAYPVQTVSEVDTYWGFPSFYGTMDFSDLPDGEYILTLLTKAETESSWQYVRSADDVTNSLAMTISGESITFEPLSSDWFVTTDIKDNIIKEDLNSSTGNGEIKVYNAQGQLVYTSKSEDFDINNVPGKGMLIIKNGKNVKKQIAK